MVQCGVALGIVLGGMLAHYVAVSPPLCLALVSGTLIRVLLLFCLLRLSYYNVLSHPVWSRPAGQMNVIMFLECPKGSDLMGGNGSAVCVESSYSSAGLRSPSLYTEMSARLLLIVLPIILILHSLYHLPGER